jgi:hypothetical protein
MLDGNTVGRWERGATSPNPHHTELLCELYGKSPTELELVPGTMDEVDRRQFLTSLGALGGLTLLGQDLAPASTGQQHLDELEEVTQRFGSWYWRFAPGTLAPLLREHQRRLLTSIDGAAAGGGRQLGSLAAQTTVLHGLTNHRQGDHDGARERFLAAARVAQLVGDRSSETMALIAHRALLTGPSPIQRRERDVAYQLLQLAERTAGPSAPAPLRTWLHCSQAEEAGALGLDSTAHRHLEQAEHSLAQITQSQLSGFYDHWDLTRLEGWRASTMLALGRGAEAAEVLMPVVERTPPELTGPRTAVVADLAASLAQAGELHEACRLLSEAVVITRKGDDQEGMARTLWVRREHLERWASEPAVRKLDQILVS